MSLQIKHRPKTFDDFMGNETAIKSLLSVLDRDKEKIPHSFFFTGLPGGGKTSLGRIVKDYLNISEVDFHEYNTSNTRGIDTIRGIADKCQYSPIGGDKKFYLMDEFHMITGPALEALLKLLEEPPDHVYFCLCTSEPSSIKPNTLKAVRRRCHEIELKPLVRGQIIRLMKAIYNKEGKDFNISVLRKIASCCWGSAGQAVKLLDSVIDIEDEETALEAIENLVVSESALNEICQALIDPKLNSINKWTKVRKLLKTLNGEPESIRYGILNYLNTVLLNRGGLPTNIAAITACFTDSFMYTGRTGVSLGCFYACMENVEHVEQDIPF